MMAMKGLTPRLIFHVIVVCLGALQFGYHLSELNAPEAYISCQVKYSPGYNETAEYYDGPLVDCIPMNASQIGLANSIFSVGGFLSATIAGRAADRFGRRGLSMINCISYIIGPAIMSVSTNFYVLMLGRFVSGLGSGSSLIVTPMYLNEISTVSMAGMIGAMCQEFVNLGILSAQVFGIFFSSFKGWRIIVSIGGIIGICNLILIQFCVESPKWLTLRNRTHDAKVCLMKLRGLSKKSVILEEDLLAIDEEIEAFKQDDSKTKVVASALSINDSDDSESTLSERDRETEERASYNDIQADNLSSIISSEEGTLQQDDSADITGDFEKVSYKEFLTSRYYRRPLIVVIGILTAQQLCGINTMIFYGVTILSTLFPTASVLVNVLISLLNCIVNLIVAPFVDRVGRKPLLLLSIGGMCISSFLLAFGILRMVTVLSGIAATIFVAMFSVGLGPIPFLIIPELTDSSSVGVAQSVGFTCNWISTFLLAISFSHLNSYRRPKERQA
ncbi:major facilitator superfamily domain-containing protein [Dipodascopsis uninucleata]